MKISRWIGLSNAERILPTGSKSRGFSRRATLLIFLIILCLAIVIGIEVSPIVEGTALKDLTDNIVSALIAAVVVGITYEHLLYSVREDTLRGLLEDHREKAFEALRAYMLLKPDQLFGLLKNIAVQTKEIPTLYRPPREEGNEFTFAESIEYFDILLEVRRVEIVRILRSWIAPQSHQNLKFLASDFIGLYRLCELTPFLRAEAYSRIQQLTIDSEDEIVGGVQSEIGSDLSWVLNYFWAASRCEDPMYASLGELLCRTKDDRIQNWILFVPLQMPDEEFLNILDEYLARGDRISKENLRATARALAYLERAGRRGRKSAAKILVKHLGHFKNQDIESDIEKIWSSLGLTAKWN